MQLSAGLIQWRLSRNEEAISNVRGIVQRFRDEYEADRLKQTTDRLAEARKTTWTLVGMLATAVGTIVTLLEVINKVGKQ